MTTLPVIPLDTPLAADEMCVLGVLRGDDGVRRPVWCVYRSAGEGQPVEPVATIPIDATLEQVLANPEVAHGAPPCPSCGTPRDISAFCSDCGACLLDDVSVANVLRQRGTSVLAHLTADERQGLLNALLALAGLPVMDGTKGGAPA